MYDWLAESGSASGANSFPSLREVSRGARIDKEDTVVFHRPPMDIKGVTRVLVVLLASVAAAVAGTEPRRSGIMSTDAAFEKGAHEFQNVTGVFFFFDTTKNNR